MPILRWLADQARYLGTHPLSLVAVLGALGAGAIVAWPPADAAFDYTWRDPAFCDDCHIHDYANEAYARSVHAGMTTCHDCHRVPIAHYPRNLVGAVTFDRSQKLEHAPTIPSVICDACHTAGGAHEPLTGPMTDLVRARVVKVDESPLHRVHLDAEHRNPGALRGGEQGDGAVEEGPITCMDCHGGASNRAHRFEASRDNCVVCHEGISHAAGRLADLACQDCHFRGFVGAALPPP